MRILIGPGLFATEGASRSNHEPSRPMSYLLSGEQHRRQRRMLNPVFSTKHLREMVPLFYRVTHQVCPFLVLLNYLKVETEPDAVP